MIDWREDTPVTSFNKTVPNEDQSCCLCKSQEEVSFELVICFVSTKWQRTHEFNGTQNLTEIKEELRVLTEFDEEANALPWRIALCKKCALNEFKEHLKKRLHSCEETIAVAAAVAIVGVFAWLVFMAGDYIFNTSTNSQEPLAVLPTNVRGIANETMGMIIGLGIWFGGIILLSGVICLLIYFITKIQIRRIDSLPLNKCKVSKQAFLRAASKILDSLQSQLQKHSNMQFQLPPFPLQPSKPKKNVPHSAVKHDRHVRLPSWKDRRRLQGIK